MRIENRLAHEVMVFDKKDVTFSSARKCFVLKSTFPAPSPLKKFPASKVPSPRVHFDAKVVDAVDGILVREEIPGRPVNVPASTADTLYIVSRRFAEAAHLFGRQDFVFPDGMVRDQNDNPVGCIALGRPISASHA
jgi:hypothetical protein